MTEFVAPEYVELVENNLRRRLSGEPAAERYEVELLGSKGQVTRVELSSTLIDSASEPALLLTALEMMPGAIPTAIAPKPRGMVTLDAMGESVSRSMPTGASTISIMPPNCCSARISIRSWARSFSEVASLVDET